MPTASTYLPDVYVLPNYHRQRLHATLVEESYGKSQKDAQLPVGGRWRFTFNTMPMLMADRAALLDFLEDQQGMFGTFYFFDKARSRFTSLSLGTTTAGVLTYTVPFKKNEFLTDAQTISSFLLGGTPQTNPTHYSLGTAANGEITLVLVSDPGNGQTLVVSGDARRRVIVRQDTDTEDEGFLEASDEYGSSAIALLEEL